MTMQWPWSRQKWRNEFEIRRQIFGLPLGRNGWKYGLLMSADDCKNFRLGWFREAAFASVKDEHDVETNFKT
jgi:hypothetical protein